MHNCLRPKTELRKQQYLNMHTIKLNHHRAFFSIIRIVQMKCFVGRILKSDQLHIRIHTQLGKVSSLFEYFTRGSLLNFKPKKVFTNHNEEV